MSLTDSVSVSEDIVPDQQVLIIVDRGDDRPIIFLTKGDTSDLIIVNYRAREQVDVEALDGGACDLPEVDESVIASGNEDCPSRMSTKCIDLARVGPNLANQLSCLAEEKFDRAAGVAHDEHGQAQAQHVCASDRIVLQGAFNLLILLHYLPLLIQLRLQKECLSGTCRGQQYLRALVASHSDNGCCNAHSEGTVRHELCTAALDCDGENSAIVSRQSDELLLRVLIVALRAAREPDAICDWVGSVTTHDRPARGTLNG